MNKDNLILSIAGHDPSGGAGLQVDAMVARLLNKHLLSIVTCKTIQSPRSFKKVLPSNNQYIRDSFYILKSEFPLNFLKIGLIPNIEVAKAISKLISNEKKLVLVIDPIQKAGTGKRFFTKKDYQFLLENVYLYSELITPNIEEVKALGGKKNIYDSISYLNDKGIKNIYVTGDVVKGKIINRLFSKNELIEESESDFYENKVHGTGCAISMAILCYLSSGDSLEVACKKSHSLMNNLVKNSYTNKSQNILNFS